MAFTTRALFLAALLLPAFSSASSIQSSASPQQPQDETSRLKTAARAHTRLVVVDVVATDSKGHSVTDLQAQDFVVLENGAPQKISHFSYHHPAEALVVQSTRLPPNVVSNAPQYRAGTLNVILFDSENGEFTEQVYARDQLLKFLSTADLRQPLAIFALESQLKLLHDFSTDPAALRSVVEKYRPPAQAFTNESVQSRASAFSNRGNFHTDERSIETTLNQLNVLAKILKGYPGRKNLIWLSESFPLELFPDISTQLNKSAADLQGIGTMGGGGPSSRSNIEKMLPHTSYAELLKRVSDALMDAQVAVYPVDAGALSRDDRLASQHTMNDVAAWTGGQAFVNRNDLAVSIRTGLDDGSSYYTLEYYPDNRKWDGEFRAIRINARPGVNLHYRLGYYAIDPEKALKAEEDKSAENISRALEFDTPSYTAVRFQAGVLPPSDKSKKVIVNFAIDPHTISFEHKDDGLEHAKVGCIVWAYGKDKNKPVMSEYTVTAGLKPDVYAKMMREYFPCKRELDLKPGEYMLRLAVVDRTTNQIGTTNARVSVP